MHASAAAHSDINSYLERGDKLSIPDLRMSVAVFGMGIEFPCTHDQYGNQVPA